MEINQVSPQASFFLKQNGIPHFSFSFFLRYMPLIVKKSLGQVQFVKSVIQKGSCQVKELIDFADHKLSPQLVTDLCRFVEAELGSSKYKDVNRTELVKAIMIDAFGGDFSESEKQFLDETIQFALDHNLIKKSSILGKALTFVGSLLK